MMRLALLAALAAVLGGCGGGAGAVSTTVRGAGSGPTTVVLRFVDPAESNLYIQMRGRPGLIQAVRDAVTHRLNRFPDFHQRRMGWSVSPSAHGRKDCSRTIRITGSLGSLAPGDAFKRFAGQKLTLVMYGGGGPGALASFPENMMCRHTLFALQTAP